MGQIEGHRPNPVRPPSAMRMRFSSEGQSIPGTENVLSTEAMALGASSTVCELQLLEQLLL